MKTSAKIHVQQVVALAVANGMKHVVVSPGSRNAPLIIAFNQHPDIACITVPDERSAAFIALGIAQQTKRPVGTVCSSGSAPLNYYPAVSEAYYQGVPLFIFTADRPQAWVDQGDGQTIVQHAVFQNHIRYSTTLPEATSEEALWHVAREANAAFQTALGPIPGPVHINMPFSEPLYEQVTIENEIQAKFIDHRVVQPALTPDSIAFVQKTWQAATKIMILVGQHEPDAKLHQQLRELAQNPAVTILTEHTSNQFDRQFNACIDRSLNSITKEMEPEFAPEILITIGGAIVSKRIKQFLRRNKPRHHWRIGMDFPFMDTYQALTASFSCLPTDFFPAVMNLDKNTTSRYAARWKQVDYLNQEQAKHYLQSSLPFSDLTVFETVLDFIPDGANIHVSNSSVIRYVLLFDPVASMTYWCNRGTSGIDGSSSTAVGAAYATPEKLHVLLTGDLSFFYDSNAFFNKIPKANLRIILINNGGGGIFKIIPGPGTTEELNDFFVFQHDFDAEHIAQAFHLKYFKANNLEEIERQMPEFYAQNDDCAYILEIFTDGSINDGELSRYFDELRAANR